METKKCLITGANGFIGSHLVTALKDAGHTVINIPHETLVYNPGALDIIIPKDIDWIFHLAAAGNMYGKHDDFDIFSSNLGGAFNLLQATKDIPYKAFINVSSSSVSLPHQTIYSATKFGAEALCNAFVDEYKKQIVTVRPYSVYGPGEASFRFIPTVFRSCLMDEPMTLAPDARHDWVFIDDLIKKMLEIAEDFESGKIYEIGSGIPYSNEEIVKEIESITGKKANIKEIKQLRSFDTRAWWLEARTIKPTPLREGLQKYYESIK